MTDNTAKVTFLSSIHARFAPRPDITAYELAQLLPFFHGRILTEATWEELGTATRHLDRTPAPAADPPRSRIKGQVE